MHHQSKGHAHYSCDRHGIPDEIEVELVIERRVDHICCSCQKKSVTVRVRTHDRLGADIGVRARPVLDDEWLAEPLLQPLSNQARDDVGCPSGGVTDDEANWSRRPCLSVCSPRYGRQFGRAGSQSQKLSTVRGLHRSLHDAFKDVGTFSANAASAAKVIDAVMLG